MALEQEFNISIPDEDAEKIKTVADAVEYIRANTCSGRKSPGPGFFFSRGKPCTGQNLDGCAFLCQAIGHEFQNQDLLLQAITHSTYAYEQRAEKRTDNERLEFLGDAVSIWSSVMCCSVSSRPCLKRHDEDPGSGGL
jgi:hypothetical protein